MGRYTSFESEAKRLKGFVDSNETYKAILHCVTDSRISQSSLLNKVSKYMKKKRISSENIRKYSRTLSAAGVLHCWITPASEGFLYQRAPLGKEVAKQLKL